MSKKKILLKNKPQFIFDIERVYDVLVWADGNNNFFPTTKKAVLKEAEITEIKYYISDKIFKVRRDVMILI